MSMNGADLKAKKTLMYLHPGEGVYDHDVKTIWERKNGRKKGKREKKGKKGKQNRLKG